MMLFNFYKYHGTGNDFILLDNTKMEIADLNNEIIRFLCHRRFGIGADGLIILQKKQGYDFEMVYYNADGNISSMCGNGGRCIVAFARKMGLITDKAFFLAVDGDHEATIINYTEKNHHAVVSLKMSNVADVESHQEFYFLNTGSPHYVKLVDNVIDINVNEEGRKIRNSEPFSKEGTNVNFVQINNEYLQVRTYERGVEEETWSCGTGVTASALVSGFGKSGKHFVNVKTPGGDLKVFYEKDETGYKNIFLVGAATFVFEGRLEF